jgi:protein-L-isoaspartate(D-aspartate) O-methyltransferase
MVQAVSDEDSAARRQRMVDGQLRTCDVTDQLLLAAFAQIKRETFVPPALASLAYLDRDVPALGANGRLLLAPMVLAKLIQAANVRPGDKALDVAGGSGYSAAVLTSLGAEVVACESDAGALEAAKKLLSDKNRVKFFAGDLFEGAPGGPFDVILINGAFERSPEKLLTLLSPNGRLVGVDASLKAAKAVLIERSGSVTSGRFLFDATAPKLDAFAEIPSFAF